MTVTGAPTPDIGSTGQATPVLDPLNLPLAGCQLIEASAGTGKTWTIAALMLRFQESGIREPSQCSSSASNGSGNTRSELPINAARVALCTSLSGNITDSGLPNS